MVSFREEVPEVEFVGLELNHFRTVTKDNVVKTPDMILPPGSNYNRSDRLALDLSPLTNPELEKEDFRALEIHPDWTLYWDGKEAYSLRYNIKRDKIEIFDVKNKRALVGIRNENYFKRTWGHVIVLSTDKGGDTKQHTIKAVAKEAGFEASYEYTVMGAW